MKSRIISILLLTLCLASLISGCALRSVEQKLDQTEEIVEESIEAQVESQIKPQSNGQAGEITNEEAQEIALKHAGLDLSAVERLHAEYEIDDGIPHYNVEFYHDYFEYEYEIHAETGDVLSFDKDN